MTNIDKTTPMEDLTIGGNIYEAGNAREFKTGDWRSVKPVWIEEKCKQCGLFATISLTLYAIIIYPLSYLNVNLNIYKDFQLFRL